MFFSSGNWDSVFYQYKHNKGKNINMFFSSGNWDSVFYMLVASDAAALLLLTRIFIRSDFSSRNKQIFVTKSFF